MWKGKGVLTPFDDYPVHQTSLPLAHAGGGHPDHYDRFWFNGYRDDLYFAVALGTYPNRDVIDAAFSTVYGGVQRSVFASGRLPLDRSETRIGPIRIEIVEPLRVNRVRVDAPEQGIVADLIFTARTAAYEEPRQVRWAGHRLAMDVTRATQLGSWSGRLRTGDTSLDFPAAKGSDAVVYGTKDRSWGIRPVGDPTPSAPAAGEAQIFFLWAPVNFGDRCLHYMVFEDAAGQPWSETAAVLPVIGPEVAVFGPGTAAQPLRRVEHAIDWAPGLRRSKSARLTLHLPAGGTEHVELDPLLTFRMRGAGYFHPVWTHGRWHQELSVGGEEHRVEELDCLALDCIHVQQVVRASWGERRGLGVLEQLAIGPHAPSGFTDLLGPSQ
jgi:hypothetical protein